MTTTATSPQNAHIRQGLTADTFTWAFTSTEQGNWHPLTWMSHALDVTLFRLNPAGHHFTSILIHAVNVILLFLILMWATSRPGPSLFVAALFAVHPINVESVAWVAERKYLLSTTFFLLTLLAYGWYARKPGWQRFMAVVALFAAGLAAKPMVITLPFVLLLLDYWPLARVRGGEHGPEHGGADISVVTAHSRKAATARAFRSQRGDHGAGSASWRSDAYNSRSSHWASASPTPFMPMPCICGRWCGRRSWRLCIRIQAIRWRRGRC